MILVATGREIYRYVRFREVALQKCLLICGAAGLVLAAAALESHLIVVAVAITSFHAVQYIAITWIYNRNKYARGPSRDNPITSRLVHARRWWLFYAAGILYGTFVALGQRVDLLVPLAYTFTGVHFVVDARIWKVKYCPDVRQYVGPIARSPRAA